MQPCTPTILRSEAPADAIVVPSQVDPVAVAQESRHRQEKVAYAAPSHGDLQKRIRSYSPLLNQPLDHACQLLSEFKRTTFLTNFIILSYIFTISSYVIQNIRNNNKMMRDIKYYK